ncbi:uncharacterized protein LOC109707349 isoform X4 [Ananas comosus]|uniref:Uncharacterized protein LOC109707349 isoform X4 n=1 Tax=Ananas comosus TaxID=4615 RepID=A0A6P5EL28_ANACO|nr:uncharacterized protein LOC109707349 isoform X4 [Ananas comosus]
MIPFSGGGGGAASSGGRRRPLPPLPPLASSLSPLAPPFTVDRPLPFDPNPHAPTAPTAPGLYSLPPLSAAAAPSPQLAPPSAGYRFSAGAGVVEADPYYPSYSPSSNCSSEPLPGFEGFWRVGSSPWDRPLEGERARGGDESSSWIDPSPNFQFSPFHGGETVSSTDCGISEAAFSTIQHANPCRINLDYFDCVSGEQKESRTHENMEGNYSYWSIGANNMKRDNSATISSPPIKGCYTVSNDSVHGIKVSSIQLKHSFASGEYDTAEPHISEQISSDSLDQQNLSVDSPCWKGAPSSHHYPLDIGVEEHSDKFAKGQSSFSDLQQGQKNLQATINFLQTPSTPHVGSSTCKDKQNDLFPVEYSSGVNLHGKCQQSVDGKDVNSRCAEAGIKKADHITGIPENPPNGAMKYVTTDSEPEGCVIQPNEDEKVSSANNKVMADGLICSERTQQEAAMDSLSDPSADRDKTMKISPSEVAIPRRKPEAVDSSDVAGNCTDSGEDIPLLLTSLHNLSRMLLSTSRNGYKLRGSDHELLQSVIENLKSYIAKVKNVELKAEDGAKVSDNRSSPEMKAKIDPIVCAENDDKSLHSIPGIVDTNLRKSILQALDKLPEESPFEQEGDACTLLYKNLWIEAEVALCSMKYELARMKLKTGSAKLQQKVNSSDPSDDVKPSDEVTRLISLNSMNTPDGNFEYSTLKTDGGGSSKRRPQDEIDVSVMARYRVLNGRVDNINSCGECSYELPQKVYEDRLDEADAAVMARLKVLKARIDYSNPDCEEEHPSETKETVHSLLSDNGNATKPKYHVKEFDEWNIKNADEVEASITGSLDILKGRPEAVNSLGASNYNQNSELTVKREDEVDASVMARLRILRGRIDNPNPNCGDENQKLCQFFNLDSVRQNQQAHGDAEQQNISSLVDDNINHLNTTYSEERGIWPNYTWLASTSGTPATEACPLFGSYFSDRHQGRQAFAGDSSNPSLEWEHVSKEELSSLNSS